MTTEGTDANGPTEHPDPTERPTPAEQSTLTLQARKDLEISRQVHSNEVFYVVKDPVTLRYFRMGELEHEIFRMLDGRSTLEDVRLRMAERHGDEEMSEQEVVDFLKRLKMSNLLVSKGAAEDEALFRQAKEKRKAKFAGYFKNFLFIRFSLVDPDPFLERVLPYIRFLWTRAFLALWFASFLASLWMLALNKDRIDWGIDRLLAPSNLLYLWIGILIVKTFHELAHGLTCKYHGGEVHEMGILFLVFTPCFYCNVSNAWSFMDKRQRLSVSLAGIFFEVFLAQLAFFLWLTTATGMVNSVAYNLMTVASISTVIFNANPLLRYDGYYVLSDYLEIPNLRLSSDAYIKYLAKTCLLGIEVPGYELPRRRERHIFLVYGFAAYLYRWFIMIGITLLVASKFLIIGIFLAVIVVVSSFIIPFVKTFRYVYFNRETEPARGRSVAVGLTLLFVLVAVVGLWKAPQRIRADCVVEPIELKTIRAKTPGFIRSVPAAGTREVKAGDVLFELDNLDLQLRRERLLKDIARMEVERQVRVGEGDPAGAALAQKRIDQLRQELAWGDSQIRELVVRSPISGAILTPDLARMLGSHVRKGSELCAVGDVSAFRVRAAVHENQVGEATQGRTVEIRFPFRPDKVFRCQVKEIAPRAMETVAEGLKASGGGRIITVPDRMRRDKPREALFDVVAEIDDPQPFLRPGMTGVARITCARRSLGAQFGRAAMRFFQTHFWKW